MIIFDNLTFITRSDMPDSDWTDSARYIVPDNSELANKILQYPVFEPIENDEGELVDIVPVDLSVQNEIADIKQQLAEIDLQTVRPLRALLSNTATVSDTDNLAALEVEANELREQLKNIQKN